MTVEKSKKSLFWWHVLTPLVQQCAAVYILHVLLVQLCLGMLLQDRGMGLQVSSCSSREETKSLLVFLDSSFSIGIVFRKSWQVFGRLEDTHRWSTYSMT